VWSGPSEVVEHLLAQSCELCGSHEHIEVHHVRKLADLAPKGQVKPPSWKRRIVARQRKSLVVCRSCHEQIQYGRYDGPSLRSTGYRRASWYGSGHAGFAEGS
jgi:AI2M/AI1M-like, HNH endonuclease